MDKLIEIQEAEVLDAQPYGGGMVQAKTQYMTAMQVIRPRVLTKVEAKCLEEAAIAGDEFYYSWKQGGAIVEGLTVGAAMAIARNLGNCAVPVTVEESKEAYVFTATFIDLETGFNLQRNFRQRKSQNMGAKMKQDGRAEDIIFQIGQSKAIRNVVLNACPKWLATKVMAKAKENVVGKIEQMGTVKATDMLIKKAAALSIPLETIEATFGKSVGWDTVKLVNISGALRGLEDGYITLEEAFPSDKTVPKDTLTEKLKGDDKSDDSKEKNQLMLVKAKARQKGITQKDLEDFCAKMGITEENAESILTDEGGLSELVAKYKTSNDDIEA